MRLRVDKNKKPESDIRRRYENSRRNLIRLLPRLTELQLHDNSAEADPANRKIPAPRLILHVRRGKILSPADLRHTPEWAKPIVSAALKLAGTPERHLPR